MFRKINFVFIILIVSFTLRLTLAFLNTDANDNHIDVISWILDKHELPEKNDCWSCYQPKLYYILCASMIKLFHVNQLINRIIASQIINAIFGLFTLILCWKFIKKQDVEASVKIITFAFFAFNPCLTAVNIQGTNDTLSIFFGVAAVYLTDAFFREQKNKTLIYLTIVLIGAPLSKASGLLLFFIVAFFFIVKFLAVDFPEKQILKKHFLIILLSFILIVPFAGGYYSSYKKYNSLALSTWNNDAPPHFFTPSPVERPGVISMFDSWFTFRYLNMVDRPYINNGKEDYPVHRTSLWSQLYGRTLFLHFDQWPANWATHKSFIITVGKLLLGLGIVPLILLILGFLKNSVVFVKGFVVNKKSYLSKSNNWLHLIIMIGFLSASVKYSYDHRDYSAMKSIYIFPGIISFIKIFMDGYNFLTSKLLTQIVSVLLIVITFLSITDIGYLIFQLLEHHY